MKVTVTTTAVICLLLLVLAEFGFCFLALGDSTLIVLFIIQQQTSVRPWSLSSGPTVCLMRSLYVFSQFICDKFIYTQLYIRLYIFAKNAKSIRRKQIERQVITYLVFGKEVFIDQFRFERNKRGLSETQVIIRTLYDFQNIL